MDFCEGCGREFPSDETMEAREDATGLALRLCAGCLGSTEGVTAL